MPLKPHFELLIGQWWSPEVYTFPYPIAELRPKIKAFADQANSVQQPWHQKLLFSIPQPKHARLINWDTNSYTFAVGRSSRRDMMLKAKLELDELRKCIWVQYSLGPWDQFRAILFTVVGSLFFLPFLVMLFSNGISIEMSPLVFIPFWLVAVYGFQRQYLGRRHSQLQAVFTQQLGLQAVQVKP